MYEGGCGVPKEDEVRRTVQVLEGAREKDDAYAGQG